MGSSGDQESSESDRAYQVGYRKPPKHSRFQPGKSGNPKGKPLGAKHAATVLKRTLLEAVEVKQSGRTIKTTKLHVIAMQVVNQAMRGEYASIVLLLEHLDLASKLNDEVSEQPGLSSEAAQMIRRVLSGKDYEEAEAAVSVVSSSEAVPLPDPADDSSQWGENCEGQDYRVGYRKPPLNTRFQKGCSGNPAGRPRKARSFAKLILQILGEEVSVTENGSKRTVSKLAVVFKQMVNKAAAGSPRFQALLFKYEYVVDVVLRQKPVPPKVAFERLRRSLRPVVYR